MKKLRVLLLGLAVAFAMPLFAQQQGPAFSPSESNLHRVGGVYYALAYSTWRGTIIQGNAATGSGNSIIVAGPTALTDGVLLPAATVFNTNVPIYIQDSSNSGLSETVTPSSVTVGPCPAGNAGLGSNTGNGQGCATITGTFNYLHGASAPVVSGDSGIEEAITDAGNNGGGNVFWVADTGIVTLNTGGTTTTTTTFVPTLYINFGASARVTTTITTSASWAVGTASHTAQFCSADSTLTAGTTCVANQVAPSVVGSSTALTAVLFTMGTSAPGAGAIKARVWGYTPVSASN